MDRNYYEDVILTAEEVADNQPNPRSSRNTADGHFSQLPLTGCNLTLSDSPPIETQGYRILSQFHHDKTDTLIFGDGLTNVQGITDLLLLFFFLLIFYFLVEKAWKYQENFGLVQIDSFHAFSPSLTIFEFSKALFGMLIKT